jgi:hypothetical protein
MDVHRTRNTREMLILPVRDVQVDPRVVVLLGQAKVDTLTYRMGN